MPTELSAHAIDQSTYIITVAFTDEEGAAVTPNAITWTLTGGGGGIINGREDETITPAPSLSIVLFGDDLDYSDGSERILMIEATYDSDLGSDLPLRDQVRFSIDNLIAVA